MLPVPNKKYLIGTSLGVAAALTILAIAFAQPNYILGEQVTTEGQLVCLPHKQRLFERAYTLECAIGLRAGDGKFYGLENLLVALKDQAFLEKTHNMSLEKLDVMVSGLSSPIGPEYDRYDIRGVIEVSNIELLKLPTETFQD